MFGFYFRGNPISAFAVCSLVLVASGCTLNPFDDDGAVRQTSRQLGLSPNPVERPEFVRRTRPEDMQYLPVGVTPPPRVPLQSPQALEAELAAKRAGNEAAANAPKPPSPYDGKIEPGFKPPPPAPLPTSAPIPGFPKADAKAAPQPGNKATNIRKRGQEDVRKIQDGGN